MRMVQRQKQWFLKCIAAMIATVVMLVGIPNFSKLIIKAESQADAIVSVALGEEGYTEGTNNNNKYGAALGQNNVAWCALFISWCARQAGIPTSIMKTTAWAGDMGSSQRTGNFGGQYYPKGSIIPQKGDIVYYDWNRNGSSDHVEIVISVNESSKTFTSIGGNTKGDSGSTEGVRRHSNYSFTSSYIVGFERPNYSGSVDPPKPDSPTWATLTTQDNRTVFGIGEQVQFKMNSDNAKYYVIGIDYEGERIVTSPMAEGYDLYCYGFNFTGNYTAYVSAYNGNNHVESNIVNFKVVEKVDSPTWATLATQDNRTVFGIGEQVQFKMNSDNAKYYVIGIDYEGERIVTSPMAEGYDLYCYGFNFTGNYTAYVSAYNGNNHIESNIVSFKVVSFENKLYFNSNGGSCATLDKKIIYNNSYGELPTPTKTGCTFEGWYTEKNGGTKITSDTIVNVTSDQTLYAHWKKISYEVYFDANGGTSDAVSLSIFYNSTYDELANASRDGYKFLGWYTKKEGGTLVTNNTVYNLTTNQTLYAHWEKIYIIGDINDDGKLTVDDASLLQKHLLNETTLTETQYNLADLNADGIVNGMDLALLRQKLLT